MNVILSTIGSAVAQYIVKSLDNIIGCIKEIFVYFNNKHKEKKEKEEKQEYDDICKKIEKTVDDGDIKDLLNLKR